MPIKSLFAVLFFSIAAFSAPVSFEKAFQTAKKTTKSEKLKLKHKSVKKREARGIKPIAADIETEDALFYVFQNDEDNGFVIIAGDDIFKPVIGITEKGTYDSFSMPPNFAWYLQNIEKEMIFALENGQTESPEIKKE